jgi:hypothetical protein
MQVRLDEETLQLWFNRVLDRKRYMIYNHRFICQQIIKLIIIQNGCFSID